MHKESWFKEAELQLSKWIQTPSLDPALKKPVWHHETKLEEKITCPSQLILAITLLIGYATGKKMNKRNWTNETNLAPKLSPYLEQTACGITWTMYTYNSVINIKLNAVVSRNLNLTEKRNSIIVVYLSKGNYKSDWNQDSSPKRKNCIQENWKSLRENFDQSKLWIHEISPHGKFVLNSINKITKP